MARCLSYGIEAWAESSAHARLRPTLKGESGSSPTRKNQRDYIEPRVSAQNRAHHLPIYAKTHGSSRLSAQTIRALEKNTLERINILMDDLQARSHYQWVGHIVTPVLGRAFIVRLQAGSMLLNLAGSSPESQRWVHDQLLDLAKNPLHADPIRGAAVYFLIPLASQIDVDDLAQTWDREDDGKPWDHHNMHWSEHRYGDALTYRGWFFDELQQSIKAKKAATEKL